MLREIGGRPVGAAAPLFVIAEIGLNHGGSVDRALAMVDAAAAAGASAVKLQTLRADGLVAASCPAPAHVRAASLRDFFAAFELDVEAHQAIVARARAHRLAVVSTPLSDEAVGMLEWLDVDAYKIASGDLTHHSLIARAARTGRPVILSTGMSTLAEVVEAVRHARSAGGDQIAALHCVSAYPTPVDAQNLRAIGTLANALGVPVGLSDHGSGLHAAIAAVALGACIYERHFVLDGDADAIDRAVSSTETELAAIVRAVNDTRLALGDGRKIVQPAERPNVVPSRRGLYAARALRAGDRCAPDDLIALRPASAFSAADLPLLVGATVRRDVPAGAPLSVHDVLLARERAA